MFLTHIWNYKGIREVENLHTFRYQSKSDRGAKRKLTKEEMQIINERNAIRTLRRKIDANFDPGDLFLSFTYRRGMEPDPEMAKGKLKYLLDTARKKWKQAGQEFYYIVVTEYKNKRIHHHLIVKDLEDGTGAKVLQELWKRNGNTGVRYLYEEGRYQALAEYLIKETQKTFRDPKNPNKLRYSCSRNLINPKPETRRRRRDDWPELTKAPKGYILETDSLVNGINKLGYRYQYYRLIKVGPDKGNTLSGMKSERREGMKRGVKKRSHKDYSEGNAGDQKDGSPADGAETDSSLSDRERGREADQRKMGRRSKRSSPGDKRNRRKEKGRTDRKDQ